MNRALITWFTIGSSLCSAKLPELQGFRKRPFCNGGCNTLSKIVFYLVFRSSLLLRFHNTDIHEKLHFFDWLKIASCLFHLSLVKK